MELIHEATEFLARAGFGNPDVGVILGTGLGGLAQHLADTKQIEYKDIPGFVTSTVESHQGRLLYGSLAGKKAIVMQGRFHAYEGYSMQQITFPVRVMKALGTRYLLISNAAGSLNPAIPKGSLMLIDDHINLQSANPLTGPNDDTQGPRFPDMSRPYHPMLCAGFENAAQQLKVPLHKGIYVAVNGPNLETRAEYRFLRMIGGDAVGMSTVPEVIVANHVGLPVAAVSVITDECDPDNLQPVDIRDILETAARAEPVLTQLFLKTISTLN